MGETIESTDVLGRDAELAAIERFLDGPLPRALVLEGEAGIGKTTLWRAACAAGSRRGLTVLAATAASAETPLAYAALSDLLGEVDASLIDALPDPQRVALRAALLLDEPGVDGIDARAVALGTLGVIAAAAPAVVAVDDVQWLDAASAAALAFAARRLRSERVAVVLAVRRDIDAAVPTTLERALPDDPVRMPLRSLSLGAVARLLARVGVAELSRPMLRRIHELSAGNPLYAIELGRVAARALRDSGAPELPLPPTLMAALDERVAALPASAIVALRELASRAAPPAQADDRLLPAVAAGIVVRDGVGRTRFTHPLLAASALASVDPDARRALHRSLAEQTTGEERARHLAQAQVEPDGDIADELERAALSAAARGAPAAAAELAESALRLTPPADGRGRYRRALLAGRNRATAGDADEGSQLLREAIELAPDGPSRAVARMALVRFPENFAETRDVLVEALADAEGAPDVGAKIATYLAEVEYVLGVDPAARAAETAALARESDDPLDVAVAAALRAWLDVAGGRAADVEPIRAAYRLETERGRPSPEGPGYQLAHALVVLDRHDEAREHLAELIAAGVASDDLWTLELHDMLATAEYQSGHWAAAEAVLREAREISRGLGLDELNDAVVAPLGMLHASRGEYDEAERLLAVVRVAADRLGGSIMRARAHGLGSHLAMCKGQYAQASQEAEGMVAALGPERCNPAESLGLYYAAEARLALGDVTGAAPQIAELRDWAERVDLPRVRIIARRVQALELSLLGRHDEATALADAARAELPAFCRGLEHGRTLLFLGTVYRRARRRADARRILAAAVELFDTLPSPPYAELARAELASVAGRPAAAAGVLTPAEARVAELARGGASTKEIAAALFVSPKTVENHLSRIYEKLGVKSRVELLRRLETEGETPIPEERAAS